MCNITQLLAAYTITYIPCMHDLTGMPFTVHVTLHYCALHAYIQKREVSNYLTRFMFCESYMRYRNY